MVQSVLTFLDGTDPRYWPILGNLMMAFLLGSYLFLFFKIVLVLEKLSSKIDEKRGCVFAPEDRNEFKRILRDSEKGWFK